MKKLYTKDHFWLEKVAPDSPLRGSILPPLEQENLYIFGASQYGIGELGEVVAVDIIKGNYRENETFGAIESRKAAVDLSVPAISTVVHYNTQVDREPTKYLASLNGNPEQVWLAILQIDNPNLESLCMDVDAYKAYCDHTK